jgi:hypothetical protein
MPTPDWAECLVEIYEEPGFLDDCFRSSTWTKFQSATSESFANLDDISGDYAIMSVTEGAVVNGCGWRRDISSLSLRTNTYPLIRARLRGRGTDPRYRIEVEYTDASVTNSGWIEVPSSFDIKMLQLTEGKTIKYIKLYARSNSPNQSAEIDYDYVVILKNPPLIPTELTELIADLVCNVAVSSLKLRILNDPLLGVTERRYSLETNMGTIAYDLSPNKHQSGIVNATWNTGRYGQCLYFLAGSNCRLETGYTTTIDSTESRAFTFWVKSPSGASGIVLGFGKTVVDWNRIQLNWSSDKLRLYVKDDSGNILQYTTSKTIADNSWHHVAAIVDPGSDCIQVYVDGNLDGQSADTLGAITIDTVDLTLGCLHNSGGYSNYTTAYIDEVQVFSRSLTPREIYGLATYDSLSGAVRGSLGNIVMVYLASVSESPVYKLITARVIDRINGGKPDDPWVELVCEDLGEIIHERSFTKEYTSATQISTIIDDIIDDGVPELYQGKDTTNRAIKNKFNNEGAWNLLEKLANSATFSTGEKGANFYVDPGGALRFKKYGSFSCGHSLSDGSDGNPANILDIEVRESIKAEPRLANDIRVIVFEAEYMPPDEDSWTESAESWSSPDPTDMGYPQSDTGDKQAGTASIHTNTTNPGSQYRIRCSLPEINLDEFDQVQLYYKYGAGLSPENIDIRIQKGGWTWILDYYSKTGLTPGAAATWHQLTINISDLVKIGNPGKIINNFQIRFCRSSGDIGAGGFLVDKLRFVRNEKAGIASDSSSQNAYGKRSLKIVDKTITDLDFAGYVASNLLENRKHPLVLTRVKVSGRGQPGYRPPMIVTLTSLKDGINEENFQVSSARHHYTPHEGYTCTIKLVASRTSTGVYEPKVAPPVMDMGMSLAMKMRILTESGLNSLRSRWI